MLRLHRLVTKVKAVQRHSPLCRLSCHRLALRRLLVFCVAPLVVLATILRRLLQWCRCLRAMCQQAAIRQCVIRVQRAVIRATIITTTTRPLVTRALTIARVIMAAIRLRTTIVLVVVIIATAATIVTVPPKAHGPARVPDVIPIRPLPSLTLRHHRLTMLLP